jgi:hypothetical protein
MGADWAKIHRQIGSSYISNDVHHNLVGLKLEPLHEYLGLTRAELEKVVLRLPAVLSYSHDVLLSGVASTPRA